MSKGRNLTKKKWRDFRKRHGTIEDYWNTTAINCPRKFPRNSKLLKRWNSSHISMKKHLYIDPYYFI